MYPRVLFPDAAAVVTSVLGDALAVTTGASPPTSRDSTSTFLTVRRVGGTSRDLVVDVATLAVEAWAPTDEEAHDLLQLARMELHALVGSTVDGVAISRVEEFAGPASLPDPISSQSRYTMTVSVTVRGLPFTGS